MNRIDKIYNRIKCDSGLKPVPDIFDSSKDVFVTVNVEVFNHAKYLRQCIESILSQKVSFNVIINIHDDASTDGSKEIIEEYQHKYPNIIFPIIQTSNIYSRSQKENDVLTIQGLRVKGKYVAMCEGDDYWTDPYKLQVQAELMEKNPNSHLCLHIVEKIDENTKKLMCLMPDFNIHSGLISSKKFIPLILEKYSFQTSSYFFRSDDSIKFYSSLPKYADLMFTGDETMIMNYGFLGDVVFINKKMSVYRKFADGSWSIRHRQYDEEKNKKVSMARVFSLDEYDIFTNYAFHKNCLDRKNRILLSCYLTEKKYDAVLRNKELKKFCKRKHLITYLNIRFPRLFTFLRGKNEKQKDNRQ